MKRDAGGFRPAREPATQGEVLDVLVQRRRDKRAARKLMRKLLKKQGFAPAVVTTDRLRSYCNASWRPTAVRRADGLDAWIKPRRRRASDATRATRPSSRDATVASNSANRIPRRKHLQIQVNTDDNVEGRDALARLVEAEVDATLGRFGGRLTRMEVHLSDENAGRAGRPCQALPDGGPLTGRQPVAFTHQAATLDEAYSGAAAKLRNLLESAFGRLDDTKGAASIRDNERR